MLRAMVVAVNFAVAIRAIYVHEISATGVYFDSPFRSLSLFHARSHSFGFRLAGWNSGVNGKFASTISAASVLRDNG